ncbi:MAG: lipid kinase [Alphaproteobacteria bacterium]|nr:lipid kinase [Alphaproteobacteria bacterium]
MRQRFSKYIAAGLGLVAAAALVIAPAQAEEKTDFKFAWSIYVGWMPWGYAADSGIVKKWADKYGITIEVVQFNDYIESINQYTAGAFDGVTLTNMDALSIPSAGGVDTTAIIIGDFSNGNDALILKGEGGLADVKGQKVNLVEYSVSHYLLARALQSIGLTEKDVTVVNTSDADMVAAFGTAEVTSVVTWNPLVAEILAMPNATNVFDSSKIPGEIIDMAVVNTETLKDNPKFAQALAGIWYETMSLMSADTPEGAEARAAMGTASGTDLEGYEAQLAATKMFYTPASAVEFTTSSALPDTMNLVRAFLFEHALLGADAGSADFIGIEVPGGTVLGDADNVKLRFTETYMKAAADGAL